MSFSSQSQKNVTNKKKSKKNNHFGFFQPPEKVHLPKFGIPEKLKSVLAHNLKSWKGMNGQEEEFLKIMEILKTFDCGDLAPENYIRIMKIMLYTEEFQQNVDMRRFDLKHINIDFTNKKKDYLRIPVKNLNEENQVIRPHDEIEIRDTKTGEFHVLRVLNVLDDCITAISSQRFRKSWSNKSTYNIRFRLHDYTFRCCHYALGCIDKVKVTTHLFPLNVSACTAIDGDYSWFNNSIKNNPEQRQAVVNIVQKSSKPAPYIVYGPPGTGKTATIVEAVCQIWQNDPSNNILVCTASNSAGDVITKRLLKYIPDDQIYRMYSPAREKIGVDEEIEVCSNFVDGQVLMLPKKIVLSKKIVITTLCACIRLYTLISRERHFSYVFIDEAGQATEPDTVIPFKLVSSLEAGTNKGKIHAQIVLSGDPQQLGPGIRSKVAENLLGISMLERLMSSEPYVKTESNAYNPSYITKLVKNYRSHPKIIQVSNELFYENELEAKGNAKDIKKAEYWKWLPKKKFPIIFHALKGEEKRDPKSSSVFNNKEIKVVLDYVYKVRPTYPDVAVITPFAAQRKHIEKALGYRNIENVQVGTVEMFQGQEKDVIIMTTVRSQVFTHDERRHIGFLSNPKRFNVALTRAKALLIVIGDPDVLQEDESWLYFINFCHENQAFEKSGMPLKLNTKDKDNDTKKSKSRKRSNKKKKENKKTLTLDNVIDIDDGLSDNSEEIYDEVGKNLRNLRIA